MHQMFPQLEPQKTDKPFMDKVGWQLIIILATVVATLVAAIILGSTHVIGFNLIVGILLGIMFVIMLYCVWYTFRTRKRLYEQYNKDLASHRAEWQKFKEVWQSYFQNERFRWDDFAVDFTRKNMEEQNVRYEELKRQCMEAIHDAELRLDVSVKNAETNFKGAVESQRRSVDQYGEQLIHTQKQMQALEERLRRELQPDTTNQSSEIEIPPAL